MKKLLGISLVAVLAATPLMASAADLTTDQMAKANIVTGTDDKQVAAVSYVKGAYAELGTAINTKQDKLSDEQLQAIGNAGAISDRVTTAEGKITTAEGKIDALETNKQDKITAENKLSADLVSGVATDTAVTALTTRVSTAESDIEALEAASATHATKTGVTATITASSVSGTVPVLATWGNSTATTAPITASLTGAAYTE